MAAIAKFISYDGGIAFSDSVILIKKDGENAPSRRIPLSDVASVNVRKPQEDADGFIRVTTVDGQRYRVFFETDQLREAVQFKKRYDAFLAEQNEEDEPEEPFAPYDEDRRAYPAQRYERERRPRASGGTFPMTIWKLVAGILSIVLSFFVIFQSCAAGLGNAIEGNNEVGGSAGVIVAILLLAGGIVSIAARKGSRGGNIALTAMFSLAAIVGFVLAGSYGDLKIWSAWCLINALLAVISLYGSSQAARRFSSTQLYIMAACAVAAVGVIAIVISAAGGSEKKPAAGAGGTASQQQSDPSAAQQQAAGPVQLGNYTVEIKDAYMATDYDGRSSIVINYTWSNNSENPTCAEVAFSDIAYQDGIQLDSTGLAEDTDASWTEIKPGATLDVHSVFVLRSGSPVEFELSELFSFSDQSVTKTFDLSNMS